MDKRIRVVQLTSAHRALDVRIFHKISKSLSRGGYEVFVVARHPGDETVDGVQIAAVPRQPGRLRRIAVSLYQIYRKALELNGDVYHFHDPELMPVGLLLKLRGKHVVYDAHEDLPRTFSYKEYIPRPLRKLIAPTVEHLEIWAARRLTAVIAATPPIADRFRKVNPNTVVVHNFPILNELTKTRKEDEMCGAPSITYVGGISRERGIFELLEALVHLRGRLDCRLELAGWFSTSDLQKRIQSLPGWRQVDFRGLLTRDQVADLLARVKLGVVVLHPEPNFINSKPTKLFEYMCAGIPVVASDFPAWREIVMGANCGLMVDPMRPAAIADAIAHLLTHPQEADEMGRNGRAMVEKLINWKSEERTLLGLYRSILHPPNTGMTIDCASARP